MPHTEEIQFMPPEPQSDGKAVLGPRGAGVIAKRVTEETGHQK